MHETAEDLARVQSLLDRSYEEAGAHLLQVITPERRLTAEALVDRLQDMCLLVLATVTADGRPINGPVDGFFYRGDWYYSSATDSLRFRHIRRRPWVSATHMPAEEFSVTTHGRAIEVDVEAVHGGGLLRTIGDVYGTRFDPTGPGISYARIDAERMFTLYLDPSSIE